MIAYIQLHKQIAKAVYSWNANEGCAATWLLLHCETNQVTRAAGTAVGSPTGAHTRMYSRGISIRQKKSPTHQIVKTHLPVICVYLFAGKLIKTVDNNVLLYYMHNLVCSMCCICKC